MSNYTKTGNPISGTRGISKNVRDEFALVETAVNSKADIASPTFTGTPRAPTAAAGTAGTQISTADFCSALSFASVLPAQTGNAGKFVKTDGSSASWQMAIPLQTGHDGKVLTTNGTTESWSSNLKSSVINIVDGTDTTKKVAFDLSGITTATTRTWTVEDNNVTLGTPGMKLIGVTSASASATVDLETTFDSTYDAYLVIATNVVVQNDAVNLLCRMKIGGSYLSTNTYEYSYDATTTGDAAYTVAGNTAQSSIVFSPSVGNASAEHANFRMWVSGADNTSFTKSINFEGYSHHSALGKAQIIHAIGYNTTAGALTGIRIYASAGNISSGTFRVYGFRKLVA